MPDVVHEAPTKRAVLVAFVFAVHFVFGSALADGTELSVNDAVVFLGHSTGGGTVAVLGMSPFVSPTGRTLPDGIVLLAPSPYGITDWLLAPPVVTPMLMIHGSEDCDVSSSAYEPYRPASLLEKELVLIEGLGHNGFNQSWDFDTVAGICPGGIVPAVYEDAAVYEYALKAYVTAFVEMRIRGRTELRDLFTGAMDAPGTGVPAWNQVPIHNEFRCPSAIARFLIDDFDTARVLSNARGGPIFPVGMGSTTLVEEGESRGTNVLRIGWDPPIGSTPAVRFDLPAGVDATFFQVVSLRVFQYLGSPLNPGNLPKAFAVRLEDGTGRRSTVSIAALGFEVPPAVDGTGVSGAAYGVSTTVRIRLEDFLLANRDLLLDDIVAVDLVFGGPDGASLERSKGEIGVDELELSMF